MPSSERKLLAMKEELKAQHVGEPEMPKPIPGFKDFGHIPLKGAHNTRDLGGLPAADGRNVAACRLIRSGDLHHCTQDDLADLTERHQMKRVVDFRTSVERKEAPDPTAKLPEVTFADLPVFSESAMGITHDHDAMKDLSALRESGASVFDIIKGLYSKCLLDEEGITAYRKFLSILLEADEGATLWHCTEGKDRAGLAAVLVEHALGVSEEHIVRDYLATNLFVRNWAEKAMDALGRHGLLDHVDADIDAVFYANLDYYDTAKAAVQKEYGSFDEYLSKALHFGQPEQEELRHRYLV
ncbi:MAG: tyrosine-protein phosphatase [Eggerthellaceae bacterium]|nr:tyrosine-protein phosphatase [Eggerthellaceae bacterium]